MLIINLINGVFRENCKAFIQKERKRMKVTQLLTFALLLLTSSGAYSDSYLCSSSTHNKTESFARAILDTVNERECSDIEEVYILTPKYYNSSLEGHERVEVRKCSDGKAITFEITPDSDLQLCTIPLIVHENGLVSNALQITNLKVQAVREKEVFFNMPVCEVKSANKTIKITTDIDYEGDDINGLMLLSPKNILKYKKCSVEKDEVACKEFKDKGNYLYIKF